MENKTKNAETPKKTTKLLSLIRKQITNYQNFQEARQMLDRIYAYKLHPKQKIEFLYLEGLYHYQMYKKHRDIEALEWANDFLDDMADYAYDRKIYLKQPLIFTRAHVKFLLANLIWDEERKPWLLQKVEKITDGQLRGCPNHEDFTWLKAQLAS